MTLSENLSKSTIQPSALFIRMFIGGSIAFVLIALFLMQVRHPRPEWPAMWMLKPLVLVPIAGAFGGACFYFINKINTSEGNFKILIFLFSVVVYIVTLWLGTVLGLNGTLWN